MLQPSIKYLKPYLQLIETIPKSNQTITINYMRAKDCILTLLNFARFIYR